VTAPGKQGGQLFEASSLRLRGLVKDNVIHGAQRVECSILLWKGDSEGENSWLHIGSTPVDLHPSVVAFEYGRMHECLGGKKPHAPASARTRCAEISPAINPYHKIFLQLTALAQSQFSCASQEYSCCSSSIATSPT
jgi:hypothetical protein